MSHNQQIIGGVSTSNENVEDVPYGNTDDATQETLNDIVGVKNVMYGEHNEVLEHSELEETKNIALQGSDESEKQTIETKVITKDPVDSSQRYQKKTSGEGGSPKMFRQKTTKFDGRQSTKNFEKNSESDKENDSIITKYSVNYAQPLGEEGSPNIVRTTAEMFGENSVQSKNIFKKVLERPVESIIPFARIELNLVSHKKLIIKSNTPELELKIGFSDDVQGKLYFRFKLTLMGDDGLYRNSYNGVPLIRYGRNEVDNILHMCIFYIRAPTPGSYQLFLYAKLISGDKAADIAEPEGVYEFVCRYTVKFELSDEETKARFPHTELATYGPSEAFRRFDIGAGENKPLMVMESGAIKMVFPLLTNYVRVLAILSDNTAEEGPEQLTQRCVLQREVNGKAVFDIVVRKSGEYLLQVYAHNPDCVGEQGILVWQSLLVADCGSAGDGRPSLSVRYFMQKRDRSDNIFPIISNLFDPFVVVDADHLVIEFLIGRDMRDCVRSRSTFCSFDNEVDLSKDVTTDYGDKWVHIYVPLPLPGYFKLEIYVRGPLSDDPFIKVFKYLILATRISSGRLRQRVLRLIEWLPPGF